MSLEVVNNPSLNYHQVSTYMDKTLARTIFQFRLSITRSNARTTLQHIVKGNQSKKCSFHFSHEHEPMNSMNPAEIV